MYQKYSYLVFILLCCAFLPPVHAQKYTEAQKIEKLIVFVASLPEATFIRNGEEHKAKDAAAHLRMKREKAGNRIKTAKDFIEKVASKSSFSGKPYQIRWKNGKLQNIEEILIAELERINSQ